VSLNKLCVALDCDLVTARNVIKLLQGRVGCFKVGMQFFYKHGPYVYEQLADCGTPVFLDLKLHDIPNTVARGIEALMHLHPAPAILTVHAAGGPEMLRFARLAAPPPTKLVAVTVLTSDFPDEDRVVRMAADAAHAGLDGVVCPGNAITAVRDLFPDMMVVVPGIRSAREETHDQLQVMTAAEALHRGASLLVVGRPVVQAKDPFEAVLQLFA